jgi:hypothetical protein
MVLCSTIVTYYGPRSGQQWFYVVPLLPAARPAAGNNGFMFRKRVWWANHTIYTPAVYVVTFSRLYSCGLRTVMLTNATRLKGLGYTLVHNYTAEKKLLHYITPLLPAARPVTGINGST